MRYIREIMVLLKDPAGESVKDIYQMQKTLAQEGLKVRIGAAAEWEATLPEQKEMGFDHEERSAGREAIYKDDTAEGRLWFVDCEKAALLLQQKKVPVVVYLHEENRNCRFEAASYAAERPGELTADYFDLVYRRFLGIPWEITQTQRCLIRETVPEDARAFAGIYSDPEITRYTEGFGVAQTRKDAAEDPVAVSSKDKSVDALPEEEYIRRYIKKVYEFYGYGIWTVLLKDTGKVIGRVGFQNFAEEVPEGNEKYAHYPQLGYMIASPYQKKGLATEVCKAALTYANDQLFFEGVQIFVHKENKASIRLAEKLGFCWMKQEVQAADGKMILHGILEFD